MAEVLGEPLAGDATDLVARLLLLYPASPSAPVQPWSTRRLLMVDGHVLALSEDEHDAACRHMAGRLDALFPGTGGVYDLRSGRFAIVVERHAGLRGSLSPLVALLESHDVADVAAWLEPLPDDPELTAAFVRGIRTKPVPAAPVPAAAPPSLHEEADASAPALSRSIRARGTALASAGAAIALAALLGAVAIGGNPSTSDDVVAAGSRSTGDATPSASSTAPASVDSLADLGYEVVEESAASDGTQVLVLEPTPADTSAVTKANDVAANTVAPIVPNDLPDAVLVAVGTTADDAVALVASDANPTLLIVGIPSPAALPVDLPVVVAVRGPGSPELCAFLQAVPTAQLVGDPVSCPLDLPAVPSASLPTG